MRGDGVGDIEGKVSDFEDIVLFAIEVEGGEVADENAIGLHAADVFEVAGFASFDDAGGGEDDFRFGFGGRVAPAGSRRHSVFVASRVFKVAVDGLDFAFEGGLELGEGAAEDGEGGRVGGFGWRWAGEEAIEGTGKWGRSQTSAPREGFELFDEFAAEVIELGEGEVALADELVVEASEFVGGGAEATEFGGEGLGGEALSGGFFEGLLGLDACFWAGESEGLTGGAGDGEMERGLFLGELGVLPKFAKVAFEGGVGGFVEGDAGSNAVPVDAAEFAMEDDAVVLDAPDAGPLFEVSVFASIEDDAVTCLECGDLFGGRGVEANPSVLRFDDGAEEGAALFAKATVGQVGVIGAAEPAVGEAAREGHFEGVFILGSDGLDGGAAHGGVEGFAVDLGDGGDVLGRLKAAFDFEGFDPGLDEVGDEVDGGEVLGGKEVAVLAHLFLFAINDELVGHATGLCAFAAIGGALAEGFGGQALAGVGNAESAVNEDFERGVFALSELFDFFDREFAGKNCAFEGEDAFDKL